MLSRNFELDSEDRENYQQVLDKFEEILNYYNLNILGINFGGYAHISPSKKGKYRFIFKYLKT